MPVHSKAGQLPVLRISHWLDVDVDQVKGALPFVALDRRPILCRSARVGLQVSQPTQTQMIQGSGHGGEGCCQQPGDVAQVQPVMAQLHGLLEARRWEIPASEARSAMGRWSLKY